MKREELHTPCYVIREAKLRENLTLLADLSRRTGCRILLAQKAFSLYAAYPMIGQYLAGTTASGLYEARLGAEEMGGECHIFSPAYREEEFYEICSLCGHIVFNSFSQLQRFGPRAKAAGVSVGLRINPECSTQDHAIYDPCAPGSRLGVQVSQMQEEGMELVDGLHFHTLCEQDADALAETLDAVEARFGPWLSRMRWLNFGGGHHITRPGYDMALLISCIRRVQTRYGVTVYLEPGEAVALNAGELVTTVLEIVENEGPIAILDASAACHMPDVLEMPYRPPLMGAGLPGEKAVDVRLAGPTCLAGDVIGTYSFDRVPAVGDQLTFGDMAIYTMVKNNTFNGMPLPDIVWQEEGGDYRVLRRFGYEDFKRRLS